MDIYDTHAHFSEDREKSAAALARAQAAGVTRLMAVGGSPELNRAALLAQSLAPDSTRLALGADVGIATTGIAGPGGALPGIPVGTVCFGYTICTETTTEEKHFEGLTREGVRAAAIHHALARVLAYLSN